MKIALNIVAVIVVAAALLSFKNIGQPTLHEFKISGFAQGTSYHVTYYAADSLIVKKQVDSILDQLDSSLSIYKPYSLISRFNDAAEGVEMDQHLRPVIERSLQIFKATNGISDITVYPLMNIWGFGQGPVPASPGPAVINSILPCIGAGKIHIKGNRLLKDNPCVKIDVNGIAQGYSVDVVAAFFDQKGIQNYLVEIGGELRVKGRKQPGGTLLQVGIEAPAQNDFDEPVMEKIIQLDHGAVTTSGNYRKYRKLNGKVITHLMNPKTGYPFHNELISVTVYAKDAITADGYDNALMGMGLKKAFLFLSKHKELEAFFIYHNAGGAVKDTATTGFSKLIKSGISRDNK